MTAPAAPWWPPNSWSLFTRSPRGANTGAVPIVAADVVTRRISTGSFAISVPWTEDRWLRLPAASGLILRRGGRSLLSGVWTRRVWRQGAVGDEHPDGLIDLEGVDDNVIGTARLVVPDPTRTFATQNAAGVPDVWSMTGPIESIMYAMVNLNAGPGARVERRIPGLVMGEDQARGPVVAWKALRYPTLQDELRRLAARAEQSGVRLLPAFEQTGAGLTFHVRAADDRTGLVVFGAGLGNLDDQEYVEDGGEGVLRAVVGGKGEGAARVQREAVQADPFTLAFGTLPEVYIDRRDSSDSDSLQEAADDAIADGVAVVSWRGRALDTEGTRFGVDFDLNTLASVRVGPAGYEPISVFDDLVRELHFELNPADRTDTVRAAVGHEGASTGVELPSLKRLAALRARVAKLERSP